MYLAGRRNLNGKPFIDLINRLLLVSETITCRTVIESLRICGESGAILGVHQRVLGPRDKLIRRYPTVVRKRLT